MIRSPLALNRKTCQANHHDFSHYEVTALVRGATIRTWDPAACYTASLQPHHVPTTNPVEHLYCQQTCKRHYQKTMWRILKKQTTTASNLDKYQKDLATHVTYVLKAIWLAKAPNHQSIYLKLQKDGSKKHPTKEIVHLFIHTKLVLEDDKKVVHHYSLSILVSLVSFAPTVFWSNDLP